MLKRVTCSNSNCKFVFVVFYSDQRESPSPDSLKSCEGKSVAQYYFSELVDHVNAAECSGNTHSWVVIRKIQGKCVGQISRWPVVSSRTRVVECHPAQWHASCACFRSSRSLRCFDDGKAHCITAFEEGCPFPTVPDHCKRQSLERSSCYIVLIVLWSSWQFM